MATVVNNSDFRSKIAGEALSDYQYYFMTLETDNTLDRADSTSDIAYGVLKDWPSDASAGQEVRVTVSGETKVVASEALAIGALVAPNNDGKAQTAVSGQYPRGRVVQAAGADLDLATIQLIEGGVAIA